MNVDSMIGSAIERIAPISRQIWDANYRLKTADGTPIDLTIEDSWRRVASALAAVETDPGRWEQPFYEAQQDFRFLPAGRIVPPADAYRTAPCGTRSPLACPDWHLPATDSPSVPITMRCPGGLAP